LLAAAGPSIADPYADALAAYDRGEVLTALQVWKPLAEHGRAEAQYRLCLIYAGDRGVARDDAAALKWCRLAAGKGIAAAQVELGRMHEQGRGIGRSLSRAMKWYRKAAQQGDAGAQVTLGLIYFAGRGVPQNDWQALKWYGLAAEQEIATAQTHLGLIYLRGGAVPRDTVQAYSWFTLAAASGDPEAAHNREALAAAMTAAEVRKAEKRAALWSLGKAQQKAAKCRAAAAPECSAP
jgi:hypothetical protein